jgi:hypothetical protein
VSVHLEMVASDKPGVVSVGVDHFPDAVAAIAHLRELTATGPFDRPVRVGKRTLRLRLRSGAGFAQVRIVDDVPTPGSVPR